MAVKPLDQLAYKYVWSLAELAAFVGCSYQTLWTNLVDIDGNLDDDGNPARVRVKDLPADGRAFVKVGPYRIPVWKGVNGRIEVRRCDVDLVLGDAGRTVRPAGADR